MGWKILQFVMALLGAFSTAIWFEPNGPVSVGDAMLVGAVTGYALAWLATTGLSRLMDRGKRSGGAGPERITGSGQPLIQHRPLQRID